MPAFGVFKSELVAALFQRNPYSTTKMTDTLRSIAITLKSKNLRMVINNCSLDSPKEDISQSHLDNRQEQTAKMAVIAEFFDSREKLKLVLATLKLGTTFPNFQKPID